MKRAIGGIAAGIFAIQVLPGGALAAGCATQADNSALRVAALQQELMVAAFSCHDVARYNGFVLSHQPELIRSDADLKAFFVKRGTGEASYHTYKTELANSASLRSIRDADSFCARADREFDASSDRSSLSAFVGMRRWAAADVYPVCPGVGIVQTAEVTPPPRATRVRRSDDYGPRAARDDGYGFDTRYARGDDDDGYYAPRTSRDGEDRDARYGDDRDPGRYDAPAPHRRIDGDDDR